MATMNYLVDDFDGTQSTDDNKVETVEWSAQFLNSETGKLDTVNYTVDLTSENADKLATAQRKATDAAHKAMMKSLGEFVEVSAVATKGKRSGDSYSKEEREQNKAIREWARKAGHDISDKGAIGKNIVDAYHRANPTVNASV